MTPFNRRTSCFVDLCRYCIWSWSLARWQEFYCFHCFRDGWELIKQRITFHLWYSVDSFIIDIWWPNKDTIKVFSPSFQDSFFVSQKTSSICTNAWGGSWALWTIYYLECIKELLHILSCKGLDFISLFSQPGVSMSLSLICTVLHMFEWAVLLDTELGIS